MKKDRRPLSVNKLFRSMIILLKDKIIRSFILFSIFFALALIFPFILLEFIYWFENEEVDTN